METIDCDLGSKGEEIILILRKSTFHTNDSFKSFVFDIYLFTLKIEENQN